MSRGSRADDGSGSPPHENGFRALQVAIIDLAEEMPTLQRTRPGESDFGGAWILVLDKGAPLGTVEFAFTSDSVGGTELEAILLEGTKGADRADPPDEVPDSELPFASVVVPTTFDRFDQLQECAAHLSNLDYPDYEVIVVDNRPDRPMGQAERETISMFRRVRVVTEEVRGISAARNCGIANSTGDFVAFTDDDVRPHPKWLRRIGSRFVLQPEVCCVTGLVIPDEFETVTQLWFEQSGCGLDRNLHPYQYRTLSRPSRSSGMGRSAFMVRRQEQKKNADHWIYMFGSFGMGCNMSFRRTFLSDYGEFDYALGAGTPSRGGEDILPLVELLYSGKVLAYEPSAMVSHAHRRTYAELQHQIYGYGVGTTAALTALAWRNPRHLIGFFRVLIPGVMAFMGRGPSTRPEKPSDYPAELTRLELKGLLFGPIAYIHARWVYRGRWRKGSRDRGHLEHRES
jgi:cellulose synthase/poly-beta-1,6-N-acetylglucosamine synthase-like glycosyltransferase